MTDRLKTVYPPKTSFCGGYNKIDRKNGHELKYMIKRLRYDNFHIVPTYQPSNPISALDVSALGPLALGLIRESRADTGFLG